MKKYSLIMCMIFSCLMMGCSNNNSNSSENTSETVDKNEEVIQEEILEEIVRPEISRSQKDYEGLWTINEKYFVYKENEKYGIIDNKENIVYEAKYDYITRISKEGNVILGNVVEDGFNYELLDNDMNVVFNNENYPNLLAVALNDGYLELISKSKKECIFLDVNNNFTEKLRIDENLINGYVSNSAYANNTIIIVSDTYTEEGFPNEISLEGEINYIKNDNKIIYTYLGCSIDEKGWIVSYEVDLDNAMEYRKGYYNTKDNTFINTPEDKLYTVPIKGNDEIYYSSINGFGLLKNDEYSEDIYLYDIKNQKIINSEPYAYIEILDLEKDLILYNDKETKKWGYLNSKFEKKGELYDDASSYNEDGYAFINKDNKEYVIDLEGNIVSEGIDGNEAVLDKGTFIINNESKYYFVKIE